MTTKQILLSTLIFGATGNIALANEATSFLAKAAAPFDKGKLNQIKGRSLEHNLFHNHGQLNDIKIFWKEYNDDDKRTYFFDEGTIASIASGNSTLSPTSLWEKIAANNAVNCNNQIIIANTKNLSDCEKLYKAYEQAARIK